LNEEPSPRYSPIQVADWLQAHAAGAERALAQAQTAAPEPEKADFRRLAADVAIEAGLGHFFAWKFRAAVLFALYHRSGHRPALEEALAAYRRARSAWSKAAEGAKGIYRADVTFGPGNFQRGHWLDRLAAIDADIADMEKARENPPAEPVAVRAASSDLLDHAIAVTLSEKAEAQHTLPDDFHRPPGSFRRGTPLMVEVRLGRARKAEHFKSIQMRYRRVDQSEIWQTAEMQRQGSTYGASIPAAYTDSPFPLQYHFGLREHSGAAWFFPGLKPGWQGQPYFVVRQA